MNYFSFYFNGTFGLEASLGDIFWVFLFYFFFTRLFHFDSAEGGGMRTSRVEAVGMHGPRENTLTVRSFTSTYSVPFIRLRFALNALNTKRRTMDGALELTPTVTCRCLRYTRRDEYHTGLVVGRELCTFSFHLLFFSSFFF